MLRLGGSVHPVQGLLLGVSLSDVFGLVLVLRIEDQLQWWSLLLHDGPAALILFARDVILLPENDVHLRLAQQRLLSKGRDDVRVLDQLFRALALLLAMPETLGQEQ